MSRAELLVALVLLFGPGVLLVAAVTARRVYRAGRATVERRKAIARRIDAAREDDEAALEAEMQRRFDEAAHRFNEWAAIAEACNPGASRQRAPRWTPAAIREVAQLEASWRLPAHNNAARRTR